MSKLETNTIDTISGSTNLTLGGTNATDITIPSGVTITNNGTQSGFGGTNTPSFFAKLSSDQSVPTTTFTKIEVDTEQFDTDGTYDNSTNYRFTPGVAGKYLISANVFLESMSDGKNFRADIFKNGASYIFGRCDSSKAGSSNSVNFTFLDTANASDYYELYIYHDEGSNLNVGGSSDRRTSFGAIKIIE